MEALEKDALVPTAWPGVIMAPPGGCSRQTVNVRLTTRVITFSVWPARGAGGGGIHCREQAPPTSEDCLSFGPENPTGERSLGLVFLLSLLNGTTTCDPLASAKFLLFAETFFPILSGDHVCPL